MCVFKIQQRFGFMNFLRKLFKRPVMIGVLTVVCLAFGVVATTQMNTALLPDISYPALGISIPYPGASAETCDEDIRPIFDSTLKTLSNVKSITVECVEHMAIAAILFDYGTDLDKKEQEIRDRFNMVVLPTNAMDPIFAQVDFNGMAVATVSVYSEKDPDGSKGVTYETAQALSERISAIDGVASVSVVGMPDENIVITPIKGLEISTLLIVQAISTDSMLNIPLGSIDEGDGSVSFRNEYDLQPIEDLPIQIPLPRQLGEALSLARRTMDYLQQSTPDELRTLKDSLQQLYTGVMNSNGITGDEVLGAIPPRADVEDRLAQLGLDSENVLQAVGNVYDYLDSHKDSSIIADSELKALQDELSIYLTDGFWDAIDYAIAVKEDPERGTLTAADFIVIFSGLNMSVPMTLTEELVTFIMNADGLTSLNYDTSDTANLNVRLKDIAHISTEYPMTSFAYYNDYAAVSLEIYGVSGSNSTEIIEHVREVISDDALGASAVLIGDRAQFISDSISNVLSSMLIGGVLAVLVIYLFLKKVRTSLIIAITMPLSVLATLICLYFMGITLNMVTLGGLAVGIGMLVDNSIVIIESITCERDSGKSALDAAVDGTRLVAGSLIASTLTSICVFFPILFTKGLTQMIFTDMSWSVIISLVFSLLVAVTVIPTLYVAVYSDKMMLSGKVYEKRKAREEKKRQRAEAAAAQGKKVRKHRGILGALMAFYDGLLKLSLRHRWLVLLIAVAVFGSSVTLVFRTGMEFMPSVDQRTIEVRLTFDSSDNISYCESCTDELRGELMSSISNIDKLAVTVGSGGLINVSPEGVLTLILKEDGTSTSDAADSVRGIVEEFAAKNNVGSSVMEVDGVLASIVSGVGGFADISVSIAGDDIDVLGEIANKVKAAALASPTGYFKNASDNLTAKVTEYVINIDIMKCYELGVDYTVTVGTLRAGIAGYTATTVTAGDNMVDVVIRFDGDSLSGYYGGIENYLVGVDSEGNAVTLGDIATITPKETRTQVTRESGKYLVNISVEASGIDSGTANTEFKNIVTGILAEYDGYDFQESGINHYMSEVFSGLIVSLIVSFLLLFAVMACQFESLSKPFIVIFAIPLSFTGGFLALVLTGMTLNVVSFVGLIMLMGVVVNDAIVMIDRIGQYEESGMDRYEALLAGSKSRMRAIWMTTLTTVLALVPLALAIGNGAELMQPLAIVVIGGLTLATFVTLILIPTVYSLVKRVKIPKKVKTVASEVDSSVINATSSDGAAINTPVIEGKFIPLREIKRRKK